MKSKRQEKILELIHDHSVQTQEQLLAELNDAGFRTTQATISRDIKQLRIIKELGPDGVYRYSTTPKPVEHTFSAKLNLIFRAVHHQRGLRPEHDRHQDHARPRRNGAAAERSTS